MYSKQLDTCKKHWHAEREDNILTAKEILLESAHLAYENMLKTVETIKEEQERDRKLAEFAMWKKIRYDKFIGMNTS